MSKIYQPEVRQKSEQIMTFLNESGFFTEFQITNLEFSRNYLCDILTEKLIEGKIQMEFDEIFGEKEFDDVLRNIIIGSVLTELKSKGMVDSYEDDNTAEKFFLTEKGQKFLKEQQKINGLI